MGLCFPIPQSLKHMLGASDWLNDGPPICKPVNVSPDVVDVIQVGTFPRAASGSWVIQGADGIAKVFMRRRPAGRSESKDVTQPTLKREERSLWKMDESKEQIPRCPRKASALRSHFGPGPPELRGDKCTQQDLQQSPGQPD